MQIIELDIDKIESEVLKRKIIIEVSKYRDAYKCQRCGASDVERLHSHHIDRDYRNHTLDNLETLCAWCHRDEHNHPYEYNYAGGLGYERARIRMLDRVNGT
jgi:5-methylcytosine-specific restriction endonuclease McrA